MYGLRQNKRKTLSNLSNPKRKGGAYECLMLASGQDSKRGLKNPRNSEGTRVAKSRKARLVAVLAMAATSLSVLALPASASGLASQSPLVIVTSPGIGRSYVLNTTGGSGNGAVTFSYVQNSPNCVLQGNIIFLHSVGSCDIVATKAGDTNYQPVTSAPLDFAFIYISGPSRLPRHTTTRHPHKLSHRKR